MTSPIELRIRDRSAEIKAITMPLVAHKMILGVGSLKEFGLVRFTPCPDIHVADSDIRKQFFDTPVLLPLHTAFDCEIKLKGEIQKISYRHKNYTEEEETFIRGHIEEPLAWASISESEYENPSNILLIRKLNNTFRMCVDYKSLNEATCDAIYTMCNVDNIFKRLSGCKIYLKIDLKDTYYHIRVSDNSESLTSFVCPFG
jgi:hypothetical protein